jgi:hypothetical protein
MKAAGMKRCVDTWISEKIDFKMSLKERIDNEKISIY